MTATITDYVNYLTDVACGRQAAAPPPTLHLGDITPSAFIMDVFRHIGSTQKPQHITRHGMDDMIDIMFAHPALSPTLAHAAHIQEHFATTFLRQTSAVFQDHWTFIIVPAWNQLAHGFTVSQGHSAAAAGQ